MRVFRKGHDEVKNIHGQLEHESYTGATLWTPTLSAAVLHCVCHLMHIYIRRCAIVGCTYDNERCWLHR